MKLLRCSSITDGQGARSVCAGGQVSGLPTNVEFLKRLCAHPAFAACDLDTSFIARHLDALLARAHISPEVLALAAVADHLLQVRVLPWPPGHPCQKSYTLHPNTRYPGNLYLSTLLPPCLTS